MEKITITIELDAKELDNILAGAFEGACNYWMEKVEVVNDDYKGAEFASEVISKGGKIKIFLNDEGDLYEQDGDKHPKPQYILTKQCLINGLQQFYNTGVLDVSVFDADDYDRILQYALFNQIIFG